MHGHMNVKFTLIVPSAAKFPKGISI